MENKTATLQGNVFNNKKTVPQCDDETLGCTAETLVIQFDQERFKQILFESDSNPISARKHIKISVVRSALATTRKQVSNKTKKVIETKVVSRQHLYAMCEAKLASKAIWIEKSISASREAKGDLITALTEDCL